MDPNATLNEIRKMVAAYYMYVDSDDGYLCRETALELCGKIEGLDQWISNGGFLPKDWEQSNF